MTTYGDIQARMTDELGGRSDLAAQIALAIQTAIAKWERERFYFNELRAANAFNTVQGQEFYGSADYAPLATIAHLDKVTVLVSGNRYTLAPRLAQYLEDVSVNPIVQGQPVDYAYYAEQLRLYPIPDNAYAISLLGTTRFAALVNAGDSNPWTIDAEALIRCEAKMDLYESTLQQPDLADRMRVLIHGDPTKPGHRGYLYALKAETARRAAPARLFRRRFGSGVRGKPGRERGRRVLGRRHGEPAAVGAQPFRLGSERSAVPAFRAGQLFRIAGAVELGWRLSADDIAQRCGSIRAVPARLTPLFGSLAPAIMGGSPSVLPLSYGAGPMPPSTPDDDETALAANGNNELALSLLGRMALQLKPQIRTNALNALRGLTGDQFTDQQRNEILDQIIDNIDDSDAEEFQSIQTNNGTIVLTPKQYGIVSQQIEMLSPEYRDKATAAFQKALQNGQVTCPQCR